MTRPEPTIYGNCESWNFIVGKKPVPYSAQSGLDASLWNHHTHFIHSFITELVEHPLDNLWAICGRSVECQKRSRIVDLRPFLMRIFPESISTFYRKQN